jgi:hypothetical protein
MYGLSYWLNLILLLALGVLALSSIIAAKKPDAKDLIDKLAKFSGIIGLVAGLWGVYRFVDVIINISAIRYVPLTWIISLATCLVFVGLGFLFGYGLIAGVMNEQAKAKAEGVRQKLAGFQTKLGWVAIGLGGWWLLTLFVKRLYLL